MSHAEMSIKLAQTTSRATEMVIFSFADNAIDAVMVSISAMAGPLMIAGGLVSNATDGKNPTFHANADNMLYAALLMVRASTPRPEGVQVKLSPSVFADAMADFQKLCPHVDISTVLRSDLVAACQRG